MKNAVIFGATSGLGAVLANLLKKWTRSELILPEVLIELARAIEKKEVERWFLWWRSTDSKLQQISALKK